MPPSTVSTSKASARGGAGWRLVALGTDGVGIDVEVGAVVGGDVEVVTVVGPRPTGALVGVVVAVVVVAPEPSEGLVPVQDVALITAATRSRTGRRRIIHADPARTPCPGS